MYLISIAIYVGIFDIFIIPRIGNKTNVNEMINYLPKSKGWVMWQSMKASVSKILKVWTREIYEKFQGWDTKQANNKKL